MKLQSLPPHTQTIALTVLGLFAALGTGGCHSHFVEATIVNASGSPVTLVELDYPSASFGKDLLGQNSAYHYRFKILGDGPAKILWTDSKQGSHTVTGPTLSEGQEGSLNVTILGTTARWETRLH